LISPSVRPVLLYEFPFNESVRTLLRLEHLFDRLGQLVTRESAIDHHFAIVTLFEVLEASARSDLKSEMLKDLERHKAQFNSYRGNPAVSEAALDDVVGRLDAAFQALNAQTGKAGAGLANNDMLMGVKSRLAIPGGTCEFDLPAYHAWQQLSAAQRRQDLLQWMDSVVPMAQAVALLLSLLRESGSPHKVAAQGGVYQQSLSGAKQHQLLRLRIAHDLGLVPEIIGHRLMVSIRLMRQDADGKLRPATEDAALELSLCA
jgi:cell division protein ZapD